MKRMRTSMIWLPASGVVLGVVLGVSAGCSSSSSGGFKTSDAGSGSDASTDGGGGAMQACAAYAKATCTQANSCSPFTTTLNFGDEATCEQREALGCAGLFGIHGSTLTAAALDACAQAITGETCDQYLDNHQPSACNFLGTLAAGAACGTGSQCESGYCQLTKGTSCGTCATRTGKCTADGDCPSDQFCYGGSCTTPVSPPTMCNNNAPNICVRTKVCLGEQMADSGLGACGDPGMVGAACQDDGDCAGGIGIVCSLAAQMCVQAQKATTGQSCGLVGGVVVVCAGGGECSNLMKVNDAGPPVEGTCHPPAADGAPCGTGVNCTLPAACNSKTLRCTLPDPGSCQ